MKEKLKSFFVKSKTMKIPTIKPKIQKENKHIKYNKKFSIISILIILLTILLFCSGYSLGKELSNVEINATGEIAKPILVVNNNEPIEINSESSKGYYDFKIKNYNENDETTEVDIKYYIEILTNTTDEISFKIYKNGQEINMENNKTQELYFSKDIKQEDNFRIEISYNKSKNASLEEIKKDIQIKVHSEQLKI